MPLFVTVIGTIRYLETVRDCTTEPTLSAGLIFINGTSRFIGNESSPSASLESIFVSGGAGTVIFLSVFQFPELFQR